MRRRKAESHDNTLKLQELPDIFEHSYPECNLEISNFALVQDLGLDCL